MTLKERLHQGQPITALGLMSGTSLDGIDAAWIETDGESVTGFGPALTIPYDTSVREAIRGMLGEKADTATIAGVERLLTDVHAEAVTRFLQQTGLRPDVVGFHGQTIAHRPEERYTRQLGDGQRLAEYLGLPVVFDFRTADVLAGGQGAPLVPVFHRALAQRLETPLVVLNLGGVGNLTWIGEGGALLALDTGPGNALIDDWCLAHTGERADWDGALSSAGQADAQRVARWMRHPWFVAHPPKSLDRDSFTGALAECDGLNPADGAATLVAFTAATVACAARWLPSPPQRWLVTGGGRRNPTIMAALAERLSCPVDAVETVGWDGDALEAQAFGFLAARTLRGLPLTFPTTTGGPEPLTGGRVAYPSPSS